MSGSSMVSDSVKEVCSGGGNLRVCSYIAAVGPFWLNPGVNGSAKRPARDALAVSCTGKELISWSCIGKAAVSAESLDRISSAIVLNAHASYILVVHLCADRVLTEMMSVRPIIR